MEKKQKYYSVEELKILFDALNSAPTYLSKRFVLQQLVGWSDEMIEANMRLKREEQTSMRNGEKLW